MEVTGRYCDTGELLTVEIQGSRIGRIERREVRARENRSVPWLSAAFIDLQLNGYGGADFNHGAWGDEVSHHLAPMVEALARAGTAFFCPTITTNSREAMLGALRHLCMTLDDEPRLARAVPGIHIEGPYIAGEDGPRGAHPLEHVRDPDWEEFQAFQEAAGGRIRLFTLAPERPGALGFIERLASAGVTVCLGHTGAEPDLIRDAVLAGARMSTHLGNGAHAIIRRHPNYIWEQLACDELYAGVIADGHHLPAAVLKTFARVKGPERLALVSDAVSLGGLPAGHYAGGRYEVLPSGRVVLAGTPYLAGAGHLLDTGIANMVRQTDLTVGQAVHCATAVPARLLGLEGTKGHLRAGRDADLVLFHVPEEGPITVLQTICRGEVIYRQRGLGG